ncbi:MAG: Do family serine endopeptidase [Chloroherpetonaceae bacterium]|nr:Do family serine endopeptidase [Chloroherpetonaceae bacterium]MDW8436538.1 Do family serine endopeptidase [Chloroherpetonaceae bacterium]
MNKKTLFTAIGLIFIGVVIGVVAITGLQVTGVGAAQTRKEPLSIGNATYSPTPAMTWLKSMNQAFIDIANIAKPTVVSIDISAKPARLRAPKDRFHDFDGEEDGNEGDLFRFFFRPPGGELPPIRGSGSGVIISSDGYIITNHHVVKDAAEKGTITVILDDKREFKAKFVGSDPLTDIAVVKIEAQDLPVIAFGNSDSVQVGEWVFAVGNPFSLASTVTAGIVSAVGRNIGIIGDSYGVESFIQTDAAVNPGNSGGALVNAEGKLVGINTAIATRNGGYQGYSFAVPSNIAKVVAEDLIKYGKISRGYIGVQIKPVDATAAKALGLSKPEGAWVQQLVKGGAAESAGIKEGDVILSIDGRKVSAPNDLQAYVARKHAGDEVTLKVWRDGREREIRVRLKPRAEDEQLAVSNGSKPDDEDVAPARLKELGLDVKELTESDKKRYEVDYGVRVSSVQPFGQAESRGIVAGDVIMEVNGEKVRSVSEFKALLGKIKSGEAALFRIRRADKSTQFVAVEIGKND